MNQINESSAIGATTASAVASNPSGENKKMHRRDIKNFKEYIRKFRKTCDGGKCKRVVTNEDGSVEFVPLSESAVNNAETLKALLSGVDKRKRSEEEVTVARYAIEDDDGNLVKITIPSNQAAEFEETLKDVINKSIEYRINDFVNISESIPELVYGLKDKFEFINIEFPTIPSDKVYYVSKDSDEAELENKEENGDENSNEDSEMVSRTVRDEEGSEQQPDRGEERGSGGQEQGPDVIDSDKEGYEFPDVAIGKGSDTDDRGNEELVGDADSDTVLVGDDDSGDSVAGDETGVAGDTLGSGDGEDVAVDFDKLKTAEESGDSSGFVSAMLDMLKKEAEARKAEAEARAEEARAMQAEYENKAIEATAEQQEEIMRLKQEMEREKEREKRAKELAKIAEYKLQKGEESLKENRNAGKFLVDLLQESDEFDTEQTLRRQKATLNQKYQANPDDDQETRSYKQRMKSLAMREIDTRIRMARERAKHKNAQEKKRLEKKRMGDEK